MIGLDCLATYLPEQRVSVVALRDLLSLSSEDLRVLQDQHGLKDVAIEPTLRSDEMLQRAFLRLFTENEIDAKDVGLILFTHTILQFAPYLYEPFAEIRRMFGLEHASAMSVAQMNCSGINFLLKLAESWLNKHPEYKAVLICSSDKTFVQDFRYLQDSSIMGDAASVALITRNAKHNRIIGSASVVDATIDNGALSPPEELAWFQRSFSIGLVKILNKLLKTHKILPEQLKYVICSNVNESLWKRVAASAKIPEERFLYPLLSDIGHAHNSDPLLNLEHVLRDDLLQPGDYFVLLTAGIGSTFGCTLFQH